MIRMPALKQMCDMLGYTQVQTYIQSGNVIFQTDTDDPHELEKQISEAIMRNWGFDVPVIVLTCEKLREIVANNPFISNPEKDVIYQHVTFLSDTPPPGLTQELILPASIGEEARIIGNAIYLYCPNGYGRTKLTNTFFEKKLHVTATTRNWNTTSTLLEIAQK